MATKKRRKTTHSKRTSRKAVSTAPDVFVVRRIYYGVGFAALALLVASQVTYTQDFHSSNVLGDENEQLKQQQEAQKHAQEQQQEQHSGGSTQNQETNTQQNEAEIQNSDGTKLKVKVEDDGSKKVEAEGPGTHFKFEEKNGEVELQAVNEKGETDRTKERERTQLTKDLEERDLKVSSEDGELAVEHNGVRVRTNFPLSVDPVTKQLIVTTPAGQKTVAVLPDDAIANMLASGFLTTVASGSGTTASGSATVASFQLQEHNGDVVYEVKGEKVNKLFGLIPVTAQRTLLVSAQTGQVVSQTQSWLSTLVGFLSL